ncbi:MAG: J domain-containing protein [Egibacteraceae bacterium]
MIPDHYAALGVQQGAGRDEIRTAYLRRMREYHPDYRPGDPYAGQRARDANAAWSVLRHAGRRDAYDRLRSGRLPSTPDRVRRAMPPPPTPAYSREGTDYRRAFHAACLKVGTGVFVLGLVLLFTASV